MLRRVLYLHLGVKVKVMGYCLCTRKLTVILNLCCTLLETRCVFFPAKHRVQQLHYTKWFNVLSVEMHAGHDGAVDQGEFEGMKTLSSWEAARCDEHQFRAKIKVSA